MKAIGIYFLLLIGFLLLIVTAATIYQRVGYLQKAKTATGTVVALPFGEMHPQIEFLLPDGQPVKFSQGGFVFGHKVGETVPIVYLETDPKGSACIDTAGALWGSQIILGMISLFLLGLSGFEAFLIGRR